MGEYHLELQDWAINYSACKKYAVLGNLNWYSLFLMINRISLITTDNIIYILSQ